MALSAHVRAIELKVKALSVIKAAALVGQRRRSVSNGSSSALQHRRLVHVTTVPMTLLFVAGQVREMTRRGFAVSVVSSPGEELETFGEREGASVFGVEMARQITPLRDLRSIWRMYRHFRRIRPDVVHAHTPKAGLLGTIAGCLADVPVRIYHIHGLPCLTATGLRRALLRCSERTACALATRVLSVSASVREVAVAERLCRSRKIAVLLNGSANGVDATGEFDPRRWRAARRSTRTSLGIPPEAPVIGFVGRIVTDKGIGELHGAWKELRQEFSNLHLLIVGFCEPHDPLPTSIAEDLFSDPRVHLVGRQSRVPPYYAAMDIVVLPSYREGFGVVALEAAAMELPVIATRVPGCQDAVVDGVTGTLVAVKDSTALADAIRRYLHDQSLSAAHGAAGRQRALADFRPETLWDALHSEYLRLLRLKNRSTTDARSQPTREAGRLHAVASITPQPPRDE
jgi:glycosyltransferase involved in cell wall biosynthesis